MCRYADELFPTYSLPDGRKVHYYHEPRSVVDEVAVYWEEIKCPKTLNGMYCTFRSTKASSRESLDDRETNMLMMTNLHYSLTHHTKASVRISIGDILGDIRMGRYSLGPPTKLARAIHLGLEVCLGLIYPK